MQQAAEDFRSAVGWGPGRGGVVRGWWLALVVVAGLAGAVAAAVVSVAVNVVWAITLFPRVLIK
jgi:hypothetical protein